MLQPIQPNSRVVAVTSPIQQAQVIKMPPQNAPQMQMVQVIQPRTAPATVNEFPPFQIPVQLSDGKWKDDICDCANNFYPSCFCSLFCCSGMYLNAQMAQKTGFMTFRNVLIAYGFAWIFALLLGMPFIVSAFVLTFGIMLRMHIAKVYQINQPPCCGECCCAFWCYTCSTAQMARHIYGYKKVLDGDADIDRADGYGPVQNV